MMAGGLFGLSRYGVSVPGACKTEQDGPRASWGSTDPMTAALGGLLVQGLIDGQGELIRRFRADDSDLATENHIGHARDTALNGKGMLA